MQNVLRLPMTVRPPKLARSGPGVRRSEAPPAARSGGRASLAFFKLSSVNRAAHILRLPEKASQAAGLSGGFNSILIMAPVGAIIGLGNLCG